MNPRKALSGVVALVLLASGRGYAIPPPWTLEETKAKADLIVLAKAVKVELVKDSPGFNNRASIEPVEVFKGELASAKTEGVKLFVLFTKSEKAKEQAGIVVMEAGGVGQPELADGETSLLFLKKHAQEGHYTIILGKFGHFRLDTATEKELAALKDKIALHRGWCGRISDEALRKAMDGYYQKTLDFMARKTKQ
jgi:hypothetical protein